MNYKNNTQQLVLLFFHIYDQVFEFESLKISRWLSGKLSLALEDWFFLSNLFF